MRGLLAFINKRQLKHLHINNSQLLSHSGKTQHATAKIYTHGRRNDDTVDKYRGWGIGKIH
jgi:hypothetical protein